MRRRLLLLAAVMALAAAGGGSAIVDRIVATVGKRIITLSDVRQAYAFECLMGRARPEPLENGRLREVADRLVDQALLEVEMEAHRFQRVAGAEIDRRVKQVREQFDSHEAFEEALRDCGLTEPELRDHIARQANVLRFIEIRFRPAVLVEDEAVEKYYRETLVPQLRAQGTGAVPGLDEVREKIYEVVLQEQINQQYRAWLREVREQANVRFR